MGVAQVNFFRIQDLALMSLCKVRLQVAVGIESPLASVALELDVGDLGAIVLILRMEFLEMSLGIELKTEDGRTQVTLVSFDFLGSLVASWRGGVV